MKVFFRRLTSWWSCFISEVLHLLLITNKYFKWKHPGSFGSMKSLIKKSFLRTYVLIWLQITKTRSSRPEVFCKKGVLRNFAKFTGKHLWQSLFFNKVAGLFGEFLGTPCFTEHLWWLLLKNMDCWNKSSLK